MSELRIDRLRIALANAAGHEHRLEPIARQAATLLAERLARRLAAGLPAAPHGASHLVAARMDVDLAEMTDAAAADRIAIAWFTALMPGADAGRLSDRTSERPDATAAPPSDPAPSRSAGAAPRPLSGPVSSRLPRGSSRPAASASNRPPDAVPGRLCGAASARLSGPAEMGS